MWQRAAPDLAAGLLPPIVSAQWPGFPSRAASLVCSVQGPSWSWSPFASGQASFLHASGSLRAAWAVEAEQALHSIALVGALVTSTAGSRSIAQAPATRNLILACNCFGGCCVAPRLCTDAPLIRGPLVIITLFPTHRMLRSRQPGSVYQTQHHRDHGRWGFIYPGSGLPPPWVRPWSRGGRSDP